MSVEFTREGDNFKVSMDGDVVDRLAEFGLLLVLACGMVGKSPDDVIAGLIAEAEDDH